MILVVWIVKEDGDFIDQFVTCETMDKAEVVYQQLVKQDIVYSASICGVIKSTDYQPYKAPT